MASLVAAIIPDVCMSATIILLLWVFSDNCRSDFSSSICNNTTLNMSNGK